MRTITKPGARRRGSGQKIVIRHDAGSRSSERAAAAADLVLLAHGCGEILPSLRRIPQAIAWRQTASASTGCAWRWWSGISPTKSSGDELARSPWSSRTAIQRLIEESVGDALEGKVDYCSEVRDDLGTGYWRGGALGEGKLMACSNSRSADTSRSEPR
jgi:hypothetical protein